MALASVVFVGILAGAFYASVRFAMLTLATKWEHDHQVDVRRVAVEERKMSLAERSQEKPVDFAPMPPELEARITAWEEPWAQQDERATIQGLYAELGDWDAVKQRLIPFPQGQGNGASA